MDNPQNAAQEAVAAERRAAATLDLGRHRITLAVSVVLFLAFLVLPYAGPTQGWHSLTLGTTASGVRISLMEVMASWFALVGVGLLTTAVIATHRTNVALAAWMLVTLSFFLDLWGCWFRESTAHGPRIALAVSALSTFLAFLAYCQVCMRRSPEQLAAAARVRETAGQLDQVGRLQSDAGTTVSAQDNPLLVDDRRARAAQRHRPRPQGGVEASSGGAES